MNDRKMMRVCTAASLLVVLAVGSAARGDWSGQLNSVTTNSPISVGDSLSLTVTVENTGSSRWYNQWGFIVYDMAWAPGTSIINKVYTSMPSAGQTRTETRSISNSSLPTTPGDYTLGLDAFSFDYWDPFWMEGAPVVINFTITEANDPVPGDTDGDLDVDIDDYNTLIAELGSSGAPGTLVADFDSNGVVDLNDFAILRKNFAAPASAPSGALGAPMNTPEPATMILLMSAGLPVLLKRKRKSCRRAEAPPMAESTITE